ncbi:MAG: hypothetical protein ACRDRS_12685 [Pseudonocardiaceae bacterium]
MRALHRAIAGFRDDYAALRLNTAIAKLIELNNHVTKVYGGGQGTPRAVAEPLVLPLARVMVPTSAGPDEVRAAALAQVRSAALINGKEPRKVIVVPGRLVNVVL